MPTVAILVGREPANRYSLHHGYADAVWAVGATPVVLVPPPSMEGVEAYVSAALACAAVCVTGGGDIDPRCYGAAQTADLMGVDPQRDRAEIAAVVAAFAGDRPVLGICRGMQVIAVALGGTLHQDLPSVGFDGHWEHEREHEPVHGIRAAAGSAASQALGGTSVTNSIHHQAVSTTGPSLVATAWSSDGLIEAVEAPGILGLQWHPERLLPTDQRHLAPFRWVVETAAAAVS